jgi:hypothetical protein
MTALDIQIEATEKRRHLQLIHVQRKYKRLVQHSFLASALRLHFSTLRSQDGD